MIFANAGALRCSKSFLANAFAFARCSSLELRLGMIDTLIFLTGSRRNVIWVANRVQSPLSRGNGRSVSPSSTELYGRSASTTLVQSSGFTCLSTGLITDYNQLREVYILADITSKELVDLVKQVRIGKTIRDSLFGISHGCCHLTVYSSFEVGKSGMLMVRKVDKILEWGTQRFIPHQSCEKYVRQQNLNSK